MAEIKIYTLTGCPFCERAKKLLTSKGAKFTEIKVDKDEDWDKMVKLTGKETAPQIFINDTYVGGCDDLMALDKSKKLDKLLSS